MFGSLIVFMLPGIAEVFENYKYAKLDLRQALGRTIDQYRFNFYVDETILEKQGILNICQYR